MVRVEGWPWMMILILGTSSILELEEGSGRTISESCHLLSWYGGGVEQGLSEGEEAGDDGGGEKGEVH